MSKAKEQGKLCAKEDIAKIISQCGSRARDFIRRRACPSWSEFSDLVGEFGLETACDLAGVDRYPEGVGDFDRSYRTALQEYLDQVVIRG